MMSYKYHKIADGIFTSQKLLKPLILFGFLAMILTNNVLSGKKAALNTGKVLLAKQKWRDGMKTTIGKRLKELREQQRLTQEELAQYLNVSRQAISQWENDKVYPDISNIALLCQLYKISSDELLGIETQPVDKKEKRIGKKIEWIIMILVLLGASQFNLAGIPIAIGIALWTILSKSKYKFMYVLCILCIVANLLNFYLRWCNRVWL